MSYYVFAAGMVVLCLSRCHAQSSSTLMGARAAGLGYSSTCLTDEWSMFNNVGGLAHVEKISAAFSYDTQASFKPFNRIATTFVSPMAFGTVGVGIFRFGDELYSEQILALGFGNTFGLASLGIKANYIQYKATGFGSKGVLSLSFGGIATLTDEILIGAYIININQPDISKPENEKLSTTMILGGGFKISSHTFITTELEKDLYYPLKWKTGVEYKPLKKISLRVGFSLHPTLTHFGFGFQSKRFKWDYALQHDFVLGSRHHATVSFMMNHKKKS